MIIQGGLIKMYKTLKVKCNVSTGGITVNGIGVGSGYALDISNSASDVTIRVLCGPNYATGGGGYIKAYITLSN